MKSDYNFIARTGIVRNFPVSPQEYIRLVSGGKLKMVKHRGKYRHLIDDVFGVFYPDNDKTIVKKWSYPYEDIEERWKMITDGLKGFPVCFLILDEEHEKGIYRVYSGDKVLKFFAFVEGRHCTMQAYNRDVIWDFKLFGRGNLIWE